MLFRNEGGTGAEPLVLHNHRLRDLVGTADLAGIPQDTSFRRPTLPPSSAPGKLQAKGWENESARRDAIALEMVELARDLPAPDAEAVITALVALLDPVDQEYLFNLLEAGWPQRDVRKEITFPAPAASPEHQDREPGHHQQHHQSDDPALLTLGLGDHDTIIVLVIEPKPR
jgi:hypothetical protein